MSDLPVGVNAHGSPGHVPVAFVAVVEYVDPDGNLATATVSSDGMTEPRRERLLATLRGEA